MSNHYGSVGHDPQTGKWYWSCAQCGAFSGARYKSEASADVGGNRHVVTATAQDQRIHQAIYGPKVVR